MQFCYIFKSHSFVIFFAIHSLLWILCAFGNCLIFFASLPTAECLLRAWSSSTTTSTLHTLAISLCRHWASSYSRSASPWFVKSRLKTQRSSRRKGCPSSFSSTDPRTPSPSRSTVTWSTGSLERRNVSWARHDRTKRTIKHVWQFKVPVNKKKTFKTVKFDQIHP